MISIFGFLFGYSITIVVQAYLNGDLWTSFDKVTPFLPSLAGIVGTIIRMFDFGWWFHAIIAYAVLFLIRLYSQYGTTEVTRRRFLRLFELHIRCARQEGQIITPPLFFAILWCVERDFNFYLMQKRWLYKADNFARFLMTRSTIFSYLNHMEDMLRFNGRLLFDFSAGFCAAERMFTSLERSTPYYVWTCLLPVGIIAMNVTGYFAEALAIVLLALFWRYALNDCRYSYTPSDDFNFEKAPSIFGGTWWKYYPHSFKSANREHFLNVADSQEHYEFWMERSEQLQDSYDNVCLWKVCEYGIEEYEAAWLFFGAGQTRYDEETAKKRNSWIHALNGNINTGPETEEEKKRRVKTERRRRYRAGRAQRYRALVDDRRRREEEEEQRLMEAWANFDWANFREQQARAAAHNREMHALNGNVKQKAVRRKKKKEPAAPLEQWEKNQKIAVAIRNHYLAEAETLPNAIAAEGAATKAYTEECRAIGFKSLKHYKPLDPKHAMLLIHFRTVTETRAAGFRIYCKRRGLDPSLRQSRLDFVQDAETTEFEARMAERRNKLMHALNGNQSRRFDQRKLAKLEQDSKDLARLRRSLHKVQNQRFYEEDPILKERYEDLEPEVNGILYDVLEAVVCHKPYYSVKGDDGRTITMKKFNQYVTVLEHKLSQLKARNASIEEVKGQVDLSLAGIKETVSAFYHNLMGTIKNLKDTLYTAKEIMLYLANLEKTIEKIISTICNVIVFVTLVKSQQWIGLTAFLVGLLTPYQSTIRQFLPVEAVIERLKLLFTKKTEETEEEPMRALHPVLEEIEGQAGGKDESFITSIFGYLWAMIFGNDYEMKSSNLKVDTLVKRLHLTLTLKNFCVMVKDFVVYLYDQFCQWRTGLPSLPEVEKKLRDRMVAVMKRIAAVRHLKLAEVKKEVEDEIKQIDEEVRELLAAVAMTSDRTKVNLQPFFSAVTQFDAYQADIRASLGGEPGRAECAQVAFVGVPALGKSFFMDEFAKLVLNLVLKKKIEDENICKKNFADPYWDAYRPGRTLALIADDLFQAVNDERRMTETLTPIMIGSSVTYPLHCAKMEKKTTTLFDAKLAVYSLNVIPQKLPIAEPAAFYRRMLFVRVAPRDPSNFIEDTGFIQYDDHYRHLVFSIVEIKMKDKLPVETTIANDVSFAFLIKLTAKKIEENEAKYKKQLDRNLKQEERLNELLEKDKPVTDAGMLYREEDDLILVPKLSGPGLEIDRPHTGYNAYGDLVVMEDDYVNRRFGDPVQLKDQTSTQEALEDSLEPVYRSISQQPVPRPRLTSSPTVVESVKGQMRSVLTTIRERFNSVKNKVTEEKFFDVSSDDIPQELQTRYIAAKVQIGAFGEKVRKELLDLIKRQEEIFEEMEEQIRKAAEDHSFALKMALGSALAVAGVAVFAGLAYYFWSSEDEAEAQAYSDGNPRERAPKKMFKGRFEPIQRVVGQSSAPIEVNPDFLEEVSGQTKLDRGKLDQIVRFMMNQVYLEFTVFEPDRTHVVGTLARFIAQRRATIPGHVFPILQNDYTVTVLKGATKYGPFKKDQVKLTQLRNQYGLADITGIEIMSNALPEFHSILNYYPEEELNEKLFDQTYQVIPEANCGRTFYLLKLGKLRVRDNPVRVTERGMHFITSDALESDGFEGSGLCHIGYITLNPKSQHLVLADHFGAASDGTALARPVTQSDLKKLFEGLPLEDLIQDEAIGQVGAVLSTSTYPVTNMVVGTLAKEYRTRRPLKSKLTPSLAYDIDRAPMKPAVLSRFRKDGEVVDPFKLAVLKMDVPRPALTRPSLDILDLAAEILWETIKDIPAVYRYPLTDHELLNTHMILDKPCVDMNTSKGIVGKYRFPGIGKRGAVHVKNDVKYFDPKFREELTKEEELLANGVRIRRPYDATLKDECRTNVKVDAAKTRLFMAGDFSMCLHIRRYCTNYELSVLCNLTAGFAGRTDASSTHWDDVYNYVTVFGDDVITYDIASNDITFNPEVKVKSDRIEEKWTRKQCEYTDRELKIQKTAYESEENINLSFENTVVLYMNLASGSPRTFDVNTPGNRLEMTGAVISLCIDNGVPVSAKSLPGIFRMAGYGDDSIIGVNTQEYPFLNAKSIAQRYKELWNREVQMLSKDGREVNTMKIHEAEFLARGFRIDNGVLFAPLRRVSVENISNYYMDNGTGAKPQTKEVVEAALREWFHYGRKEFEENLKRLNLFLKNAGIPESDLTYAGLLAAWTNHRL